MKDDAELTAAAIALLEGSALTEEGRALLQAVLDEPSVYVAGASTQRQIALDEVLEVVHALPGGVYSGTTEGIEFISDGTASLIGRSPSDIVADPRLEELIEPAELERLIKGFRSARARGGTWRQELRVRTPTGRVRWLRGMASFHTSASGEQRYTGLVYDISGYRQTAQALARSEAGVRALLRTTRQAFMLVNPEQDILAFNEVAADMARRIGYRELQIGDSMYAVLPVDALDFHLDASARAVAGEHLERRVRMRFLDGTFTLDVVYAPVRSHRGELLGVACSMIDVTPQVEAQKAVAQSDLILSGLPLAVVTVDTSGTIGRWRGAAERLLHRTEDEVRGTSLADLLAPHEGNRQWPVIADAIRDGTLRRLEADGQLPDGTLIPLELTISPVADDVALPGRRLVLIEDVGPRRALQRQLVESHKMEAVGLFAAGLAHDFNNLLAAIVGHTAMLDLDMEPDDPLRMELTGIEATTQRAASLVRSLLGLARQRTSTARAVDLVEILGALRPLLERVVGSGVQLSMTLPDSPSVSRVDPVQLEQVLVNLAVNGRDAMDGKGDLSIVLENTLLDATDARPLGIGAGPAARIEVRDRGTGIPASVIERIFEPFFTTKTAGKGTGLGLSICRQILRSYGGEIVIDSTEGQGTSVVVWLLRSEGLAERATVDRDDTALPRGTERILLVEDVDALRTVWGRLLTRLGYRVTEAVDGADAVERLERGERFGMLVSDVVMPRLGGLAVARRFRRCHPDAPILLVSAHHGGLLDGEVLTETGARFVPKPVEGAMLARKVRAMLDELVSPTGSR